MLGDGDGDGERGGGGGVGVDGEDGVAALADRSRDVRADADLRCRAVLAVVVEDRRRGRAPGGRDGVVLARVDRQVDGARRLVDAVALGVDRDVGGAGGRDRDRPLAQLRLGPVVVLRVEEGGRGDVAALADRDAHVERLLRGRVGAEREDGSAGLEDPLLRGHADLGGRAVVVLDLHARARDPADVIQVARLDRERDRAVRLVRGVVDGGDDDVGVAGVAEAAAEGHLAPADLAGSGVVALLADQHGDLELHFRRRGGGEAELDRAALQARADRRRDRDHGLGRLRHRAHAAQVRSVVVDNGQEPVHDGVGFHVGAARPGRGAAGVLDRQVQVAGGVVLLVVGQQPALARAVGVDHHVPARVVRDAAVLPVEVGRHDHGVRGRRVGAEGEHRLRGLHHANLRADHEHRRHPVQGVVVAGRLPPVGKRTPGPPVAVRAHLHVAGVAEPPVLAFGAVA